MTDAQGTQRIGALKETEGDDTRMDGLTFDSLSMINTLFMLISLLLLSRGGRFFTHLIPHHITSFPFNIIRKFPFGASFIMGHIFSIEISSVWKMRLSFALGGGAAG